jgi:Ca2+-binding RTX toxin-like protein
MDGDAGSDWVSYVGSDAVTVSLDVGGIGGDAQGDSYDEIENIIGSSNADDLVGNAVDNIFRGGLGADDLDGMGQGAAGDTADYSDATAKVTVNLQTGAASGDPVAAGDSLTNIENAIGGAGDDVITGRDGVNNRLVGNGGKDALNGGTGDDTMEGGADNDTYFVDSSTDQVVEAPAGGTKDQVKSSATNYTLAENVEDLTLLAGGVNGTGNGEKNKITGNAAANNLLGLGGADQIKGGGANDTIDGGVGNDKLDGQGGDDSLVGGGQNDKLDGGSGVDTMEGGGGNDTYFVDDTNDVTSETGGGGKDVVRSSATYTLTDGGLEDLVLTGNGVINGTGNGAANRITGNDQANTLNGEGSNDNIEGNDGDDIINGGTGDDQLRGGDNNDDLDGGDNNDRLFGGNHNDSLDGGNGNDVLQGEAGDDSISGADGADVMVGGAGVDTMHGGGADADADVYLFNALSESPAGTPDHLQGFEFDHDVINVTNVDAVDGGSDDDFSYIASGAFSGVAGQLRWEYDAINNNTFIEGDTDGDTNADLQILIEGFNGALLTEDNFVL